MKFTRNQFIALSKRFKYGDEAVLPYPERSIRGMQLDQMASSLCRQKIGIVLSPALDPGLHYLLRNDGHAVYGSLHQELAACLLYPLNPIEYWRSPQRLNLGVAEAVSLLVNPPLELLNKHGSTVRGAYIGDGMEQHATVKQLAALGLTHATSLPSGFWLGTRDPAMRYVPSMEECTALFGRLCADFETRTIAKPQLVQLISLLANGHPEWTSKHQLRIEAVLRDLKSAAAVEVERAIMEHTVQAEPPKKAQAEIEAEAKAEAEATLN